MARSRPLAVMATATLALSLLAACGHSGSSNTPEAVKSALRATATQSGLRLTLTWQASSPTFSNSGSPSLTPQQPQVILTNQVALTVQAAKDTTLAHAGSGGDLALALSQGQASPYLEVIEVGTPSTLYARVDIDTLNSVYGLSKSQVAQFRTELEKLGSQGGGLKALYQGKWVSVNVNLVNLFASTTGITLPSLPQLVARVVGAFFNTLASSTNIQPGHTGQAQVTVNTQTLITSLVGAVANTPGMSSLNKQGGSLARRAQDAVPPGKSGTVTVTVNDGIVTNLLLNLNQFDKSQKLTGTAHANLAVVKSSAISAPSGAVPLNLGQMMQALEGTGASS